MKQFSSLGLLSLLVWHVSAQPQLVVDLFPGVGSSAPAGANNVCTFGDRVFFAGNNGSSGAELWQTDGTPAGTVLVKDVNPGGLGSNPDNFYVVGDQLFFTADDGVHGYELWCSDGTEAGTALVRDIWPGSANAFTDLGDNTDFFGIFDGKLYFAAHDGSSGYELWSSDGTDTGTVLLKNIYAGSIGSFPTHFEAHNGLLFFSARTLEYDEELWRTDGTPDGTVLVKDISQASFGATPTNLRSLGTTLIFIADDGIHASELWRTDGTEAGTVLVKDIKLNNVGTFSPSGFETQPNSFENRFVRIGELAYFSAVDDSTGRELWRTDGTEAGTYRVKDASTEEPGYAPQNFVVVGDQLYYKYRSPSAGIELWKSDGTAAGTVQVKDIYPGTTPSFYLPSYVHAHLDRVYFAATPALNTGIEPFVSDGTAAGTQLLADLNPGGLDSRPTRFVSLGTKLLFWATNAAIGTELYVYVPPLSVTASVLVPVICNGDSTGMVEVQVGGNGMPPFTVEWSVSGISGMLATNLPAGQYSVTVTDSLGNTATTSFSLTQPLPIFLATSTTPASDGASNGTATVLNAGGVPGYTYLWSTTPAQTTKTAINLAPGTYTVTVTDSNGCTATETALVDLSTTANEAVYTPVQLTFMPNPASDQAYWALHGATALSGAVVDACGRKLRDLSAAERLSGTLDVSGLSTGLYTLAVEIAGGRTVSTRFAVAR